MTTADRQEQAEIIREHHDSFTPVCGASLARSYETRNDVCQEPRVDGTESGLCYTHGLDECEEMLLDPELTPRERDIVLADHARYLIAQDEQMGIRKGRG